MTLDGMYLILGLAGVGWASDEMLGLALPDADEGVGVGPTIPLMGGTGMGGTGEAAGEEGVGVAAAGVEVGAGAAGKVVVGAWLTIAGTRLKRVRTVLRCDKPAFRNA